MGSILRRAVASPGTYALFMDANGFSRDITALQEAAVLWWPAELTKSQSDTSIIPLLLRTKGKFVSLLKLSGNEPFDLFGLVREADFPGNLFLKHLSVLTDVGGEGLKRIGSDFANLFDFDTSEKLHYLDFLWEGQTIRHYFRALPLIKGTLSSQRLGIDGAGLLTNQPISQLQIDTAVLLLFGGANVNPIAAAKSDFFKCTVGNLLGKEREIDSYVQDRYIWVSRITGGATANELGQIAQNWAFGELAAMLPSSLEVIKNGRIEVDGETLTSDLLVRAPTGQVVGIEVSFQVTTNSTIERKGNEAENRRRQFHKKGSFVAYVIDGAGNFERKSAISKICANSDCTVAFSKDELSVLASFVTEVLG